MKAIQILAGLVEGDIEKAREELEVAVMQLSTYGNPDSSLDDWIGAGTFYGIETAQEIADEWDDRG